MAVASAAAPAQRSAFFTGLRGRLLLLTVGFIVFAGLLIYPPAVANYRTQWLHERAQAAEIAAVAIAAAPQGQVSAQLTEKLSTLSEVVSVALQSPDMREMVVAPPVGLHPDLVRVQLDEATGVGGVMDTLATMVGPGRRYMQIFFTPRTDPTSEMEVLAPEASLKRDLLLYTGAFLLVGLVIAAVSGVLMYLAIYRLVVRPMQALTNSVIRFAESPETPQPEIPEGRQVRADEIRRAMTALRDMQTAVSASFRQRKRLADLGEAVAKINHDLRNSLAAAQIVSESLAQSEDPRVKRAAPRLERALERAINLAEATLRYGRAEPEAPPNLQPARLAPILAEAAGEALAAHGGVAFELNAPEDVAALVEPEHVHRIVGNLVRNSARAISAQKERTAQGCVRVDVRRADGSVIVEVADNGPGVAPTVREKLFQPFSGSGSRDGAGLGLAIARELARGMKGDLQLAKSDAGGATFRLKLPAV
jgi:signal transduction histidine kinase